MATHPTQSGPGISLIHIDLPRILPSFHVCPPQCKATTSCPGTNTHLTQAADQIRGQRVHLITDWLPFSSQARRRESRLVSQALRRMISGSERNSTLELVMAEPGVRVSPGGQDDSSWPLGSLASRQWRWRLTKAWSVRRALSVLVDERSRKAAGWIRLLVFSSPNWVQCMISNAVLI